jgi:hypothetical protein
MRPKIKNIFLLILLLLFTVGWCLFYANGKKIYFKKIEAEEVGPWHYKIMALIPPDLPLRVKSKENPYGEEGEKIIQLLIKNYPGNFKEHEIRVSMKKLDSSELSTIFNAKIKDGMFFDNLPEVISWLSRNGKISSGLATELNTIHTITIQGMGSKIILKAINKLKYMDLDEKDGKYRDAFVSVYISSYSFWRSKPSEPFKIPNLNCNRAMILANATGALYGISCGPVCAIIQAAIFSSFATQNPPCLRVVTSLTLGNATTNFVFDIS